MDAEAWRAALADYFEEHDTIDTGPDARGPHMLLVEKGRRDVGGAADRRGPGGPPRLAHPRRGRPPGVRREGELVLDVTGLVQL